MALLNQHTHRLLGIVLTLILVSTIAAVYSYWYEIIRQIIEWQQLFHKSLSVHINEISKDPVYHGAVLIALSFFYGVFHAIGPGHGKAIIMVYLSSHRESLRRGAIISLLAAFLQAIVAIILVVVLSKILSIKFSDVNSHADQVSLVSYLLIMALGAFLFAMAIFKQWTHIRQWTLNLRSSRKPTCSHHDHKIEHHHDHSCCGGKHAHQSVPQESLWQSLGVIFSMGIRPCAGAIIVLIYAHLVGVFYYGIIATLVMGLGTGVAVAGMALGTQLARNWFETIIATSSKPLLMRLNVSAWLRVFGGLVIFLLGFSLFQSAMPVSGGHPLL